jgi:hypothetical protein
MAAAALTEVATMADPLMVVDVVEEGAVIVPKQPLPLQPKTSLTLFVTDVENRGISLLTVHQALYVLMAKFYRYTKLFPTMLRKLSTH